MAPTTCLNVLQKIDMFSLNMNLKFQQTNRYRTNFGGMMSLMVVFLTLVYAVISYTELRAGFTMYTVMSPMNTYVRADENRFETTFAFRQKKDKMAPVAIDPRIGYLVVKRVELEPLSEIKELDIPLYDCDDVYTCLEDEDLIFKGTRFTQKKTYITVDLVACQDQSQFLLNETALNTTTVTEVIETVNATNSTSNCATPAEVEYFFSTHDFFGDVTHSYLDQIDHMIVTESNGLFFEELAIGSSINHQVELSLNEVQDGKTKLN